MKKTLLERVKKQSSISEVEYQKYYDLQIELMQLGLSEHPEFSGKVKSNGYLVDGRIVVTDWRNWECCTNPAGTHIAVGSILPTELLCVFCGKKQNNWGTNK